MICKHVELTMETTEPRDVAKAMLKFWLFQAEETRQDYSIAVNKIAACEQANARARQDWEDECVGGFSTLRLPYPESEIQMFKGRIPAVEANLKEAKAMAGYMLNFITDKAHPQQDSEGLPHDTK
jgi:hypothetical protein